MKTVKLAGKGAHIDGFLTDFSLAYSNEAFFADIIAPRKPVTKSSDLFPTYLRDNLRINDTTYTSGSAARRVTFRTGQDSFNCEEQALEDTVTDKERKNADKPLDPEMDTVEFLTEQVNLARENRVVNIVTDNSIITQTANAGGDWDAVAGTPKQDIFTGITTIQGAILRKPNHIFIPFEVAQYLSNHADYKGDRQYVKDLVEIFGLPTMLWGLEVHVITTGYASGDQIGASDPALAALWSDSVLICYINPSQSLKQITFMRTFESQSRIVLTERQNMQHCDVYQVYEEVDEKLVCAAAGYLITNCL